MSVRLRATRAARLVACAEATHSAPNAVLLCVRPRPRHVCGTRPAVHRPEKVNRRCGANVFRAWPAVTSNSAPTASPPQRVLRATVGTFRPAGLLYGQIHARMRVPQIHLRHRAAQRQILAADLVLVLRVGFNERFGRSDHGLDFFRCADEGADYTCAPAGAAAIVAFHSCTTAARVSRNSAAGTMGAVPSRDRRWVPARYAR